MKKIITAMLVVMATMIIRPFEETSTAIDSKIDQLVHTVGLQQKNVLDTVLNRFADIGAVISLNILSVTGAYTIVPESVMCLLRRHMPSLARVIGGMDSYRRDVYLGMGVTLIPIIILSYLWYKKYKKN